jgi:hypothetical protein
LLLLACLAALKWVLAPVAWGQRPAGGFTVVPLGVQGGLPVVITHIKPTPSKAAAIRKQLDEANVLQMRLVFPT